MTQGPGKYDDAATAARIATEAHAVVLIVLNGNKGSGFSMQVGGGAAGILVKAMPELLRHLATQIELDAAAMKGPMKGPPG